MGPACRNVSENALGSSLPVFGNGKPLTPVWSDFRHRPGERMLTRPAKLGYRASCAFVKSDEVHFAGLRGTGTQNRFFATRARDFGIPLN